MQDHPYAECFPLMSDAELQELADDIKENGQQESIKVFEKKILDGRNRFRACKIAGVKPQMVEFKGDDPLAYVLSKNLKRRHLNDSQRAMVASKLATLKKGQKKADASIAASQSEAAASLSVSRESVQRARKVVESGVPQLVQAVESGEVSVTAAAAVASLPAKEQKAIVKKGPDAVKKAAAESRKQKCDKCTRLKLNIKDCQSCAELKTENKNGKPTGKKEKVQVDGWGIPIQPHAKEIFEAVPEFNELVKTIRSVQKAMSDLAETPAGRFLQKRLQWKRFPTKEDPQAGRWIFKGLDDSVLLIQDCTPTYTVCPYACNDKLPHGDECKTCQMQNWTPKLFNSTVPDSLVKAAKEAFGV